jgi:hypothetical protein
MPPSTAFVYMCNCNNPQHSPLLLHTAASPQHWPWYWDHRSHSRQFSSLQLAAVIDWSYRLDACLGSDYWVQASKSWAAAPRGKRTRHASRSRARATTVSPSSLLTPILHTVYGSRSTLDSERHASNATAAFAPRKVDEDRLRGQANDPAIST